LYGTFGGIRGTFGMIQGTFGVIRGTFGGNRGTFGVEEMDGSHAVHKHFLSTSQSPYF